MTPDSFTNGFDISQAGRNSLLAPALQLRPDLAELMATAPEGAKLSGSGPTLYLLNSSREVILEWQERYQAKGLETLVTRFGRQGAGLI